MDPFLRMVKFVLRRNNNGSFNKSFRIASPENLEINLIENNSKQFWSDSHDFEEKDPV